MKNLSILLFLGLLTLWAEFPSAGGHKPRYTWVCPENPYVCIRPETNECESDLGCKGQKCCEHRCAKRCVDPVREKPGVCPPDNARCIPPISILCKTDFECQGHKKCCHYHCARRCMPPSKE